MKNMMNKIIKGKTFCDYLEDHGIHYEWCIKHKEVSGCEESANYYEHYKYYIGDDYCICKNLLLKERKGQRRTFLVIIPMEKKIDLKALKEKYNTSKLEFVKEEEMKELLNTTPGNVSIFNLIYDKDKKVNLVIDQDIFTNTLLAFHPLYNGMSIFMRRENIIKFLDLCNRNYLIEEIPTMDKQIEKIKNLTT